MNIIKQSTAVILKLGPFVDSTDGVTAETGLTIAQADIQISKNGGAFAQTSATTPTTTHDADGWYPIPLTTTDTNTLGSIVVQVTMAGALPVFYRAMVANANVYDSLIGGSDRLDINVDQIDGQDAAATGAIDFDDIAAIAADWLNAGRLDLLLDAIKAKTDSLTFTQAGFVDSNVLRTGGQAATATGAVDFDDIAATLLLANSILTDTGTDIPATLSSMSGAGFDTATDSLEALRNRGDAAWTTGAGGDPPQLLQNTTIATLASQTSFTLTAGSADDDAYNNAIVVVTDSATSTQKAVGVVSDYVGSTRTVTLAADPGIFTMAVGDTIDIIASTAGLTQADVRSAVGLATANLDTQLSTIDSNVDAVLVDTAEIGAAGAGLTAVPWNAAWDAEVQSEVTDALNAYDPPTNAEMEARTLAAAAYFDPTTDTVDVGAIDGSTAAAALLSNQLDAAETGTAQAGAAGTITLRSGASATNDFYNGCAVWIMSGTGAGQSPRFITDYVGSTKVATIEPNWTTNPSTDSVYVVLPIAPAASSNAITANVTQIAGQTASATSPVDFDDIAAILVDTGTTLDGKINTIDTNVDAILVDTGTTLDGKLNTIDANVDAILVDTSTTLDTKLNDIQGATFDTATDSLEALRNRGDAAWTTGAGGTPPQLLQNTTIATLASQTSFTLTDGSADDDAYNDAIIVITDSATSTQKAVGSISDYVGSTKTVTLAADPAIFTMAVGDTVDIIASTAGLTQSDVRAAVGLASANLDTQLSTIDSNVDAVLVDTAEIGAAGAGLTALPWNAAWDAEVQSEVTDALNAYDPPTNAEMEARTLAAAAYFDPATDTVNLASVDETALQQIIDDLENGGRLDLLIDAIKAKTDSLTFTEAGKVDANVLSIGSSATAATKLAASANAIISGTAATGTLTTTQATTSLTGYTADQLIGRVLLVTSGAAEGEATAITDSAVSGGLLTFDALTLAMSNGDTFLIL